MYVEEEAAQIKTTINPSETLFSICNHCTVL